MTDESDTVWHESGTTEPILGSASMLVSDPRPCCFITASRGIGYRLSAAASPPAGRYPAGCWPVRR